MKVNVHEAKTHLSRYIQRAMAGEEIIIAKDSHPLVKLIPVSGASTPRILGGMKESLLAMSPDFDDEMDNLADYSP